ncbi:hemin uptake protein HemP [Methylosinus sp. Ce-a6]|uniref:hemin uptake protein HemP n=1 Tax=Methylosinus sp. Ce-a6 TaxID=2172005 RepID=UPI0013573807|nr:hemin uptake protein HemP [Methylosinus sp. Ce-a6]
MADQQTSRFQNRIVLGAQAERLANPATREVDVRDLVGASREVTLLHAGARYRLRITANNKLILTK